MQGLRRLVLSAIALVVLAAPGGQPVLAQPEPNYLDDRSSAEQVLNSYVNAINLREYLRAYSYWQLDSPQLPSFDDFSKGYASTSSVDLTLGTTQSDVGAGQLYWRVPVTMVATMNDGSIQTFVGCYQLHLANPHIQATPPYQPISIQRAAVAQVDNNNADTGTLMQQQCTALT